MQEATPPGTAWETLRAVTLETERKLGAALKGLNLTIAQYHALEVHAVNPGIANGGAARLAHTTPQTMSLIATALVKKKLLKRSKGAGAQKLAKVTPQGLLVLAQARKATALVESTLQDRLGQFGLAIMEDLLVFLTSGPEDA
jgi:DNA-binding MarR family transcriptional regulator